MSLQFRDKDVVRDSVKCFAQLQADDVSCSSLIHQHCNPVVEGHQICQVQFALSKAMLAVIMFLSIVSRRICSMTLLGTEVRPTGL